MATKNAATKIRMNWSGPRVVAKSRFICSPLLVLLTCIVVVVLLSATDYTNHEASHHLRSTPATLTRPSGIDSGCRGY